MEEQPHVEEPRVEERRETPEAARGQQTPASLAVTGEPHGEISHGEEWEREDGW